MFGHKAAYDRSAILARAEKARGKGRRKKAIREYRKVLAQEPADHVIHGKIAPLLAATGDRANALKSFRAAAEGQLKQGFADRAIALWVRAASFFPDEESLWEEAAKLHLERQRRADAVKVYVEGQRHFKGKKLPVALSLLRRALEIEPLHLQANLALAKALKKSGNAREAKSALEALAKQIRGPALKQIRKAQFSLSPTPAALFRWLRA